MEAYLAELYLPAAYLSEVYLPGAYSPEAYLPEAYLPEASCWTRPPAAEQLVPVCPAVPGLASPRGLYRAADLFARARRSADRQAVPSAWREDWSARVHSRAEASVQAQPPESVCAPEAQQPEERSAPVQPPVVVRISAPGAAGAAAGVARPWEQAEGAAVQPASEPRAAAEVAEAALLVQQPEAAAEVVQPGEAARQPEVAVVPALAVRRR
ncbi:MAG TPA: hypothetical protein VNJ49_11640, partial [Bradyrhizobium sp.]|nr:hypothetical protein [Bradyrhizobium sp.]